MVSKEHKPDRFFLTIVLILISLGLIMFLSASLGVLAKDVNTFKKILISQLVLGLGAGFIGMYFTLNVNYNFWKKWAFLLFLGSIILTGAVFIPGLGISHGGAMRWLQIGSFSFQPAELLKFGFIIYFAAWLSWVKGRVVDLRFGILPLFAMLSVIAVILFKQPDAKSFVLITITGVSMLFIAGVPLRYILMSGVLIVIVLSMLIFFTPYLQHIPERLKTFINPYLDPKGSAYQIQQSLIAIGSGGMFGRGLGQSIQKFGYLPESHGDSIFAVIGEELGFVGASATVILYLLFALRGLRISNRSPDQFSRLLVAGIVILITAQSFMNMASITGVFPLTGVPLVFMSQGGTSLMIALLAIGIVLQISKFSSKHS